MTQQAQWTILADVREVAHANAIFGILSSDWVNSKNNISHAILVFFLCFFLRLLRMLALA